MIIVCEKCDRRFHLADGRIPVEGARVRCSKCHHRFHVMPPGDEQPAPDGSDEDSAQEQAAMAAPEPAPAPRAGRDDPDLDNPEFLFDEKADEPTLTRIPAPAPKLELDDRRSAAPPQPPAPEPEPASEMQIERSPHPEPDVDERDLDDPSAGAARDLVAARAAFDSSGHDFDIGEDAEPETDPGSGSVGDDDSERSMPSASEVVGAGRLSDDADFDDVLSQDFDDGSMDGWDPLESPPTALDREPPKPTLFDEPDIETQPRRSPQPLAPQADPEVARSTSFVLPALAFLIGLALVAGGARGVWLHSLRAAPGPESVSGAGWRAHEIEALQARDDGGRRVVVVRGRLAAQGGARPPELRVELLDGSAQAIAQSAPAELVRLDGSALSPEALGELAGQASRRALPERIDGFTALVWDPPAQARRFRLVLGEGAPGGGSDFRRAERDAPGVSPEPDPSSDEIPAAAED